MGFTVCSSLYSGLSTMSSSALRGDSMDNETRHIRGLAASGEAQPGIGSLISTKQFQIRSSCKIARHSALSFRSISSSSNLCSNLFSIRDKGNNPTAAAYDICTISGVEPPAKCNRLFLKLSPLINGLFWQKDKSLPQQIYLQKLAFPVSKSPIY